MRTLFLLISLSVSLISQPVFSTEEIALDSHILKAKQLQLASNPNWLALLHYKQEVFSGDFLSQADDTAFFLSTNGKTDPAAELEADLKAFLSPPQHKHPQCLFPARWHWLKQQLGIENRAYDVECPKLNSWLERASSDALTLVFPAMFLNNPGSMFGHTFLRFDDSKKSTLLSYALNYAAKVDPSDNFLSYAYNGLFGGYRGVFATRPYYETVQLYSDTENRDIWEYQLDYSVDEITQLLRHVWEVTDIKFDYYFLNENCSYRLLSLLDAVKPEAQLSSIKNFPVHAIPVDTVRALNDAGLIREREFRASLSTQVEKNSELLSEKHKRLTVALADNDITAKQLSEKVANEKQRSAILEQAYTILQFREETDSKSASQLLSERSLLPDSEKPSYDLKPPESGHQSTLFSIAYGENRNKDNIVLRLRPTFHGLLDDPNGYVKGAEISTVDTKINWLSKQEKLQLESLRFFNVISLSPMSHWNKPLSWKFDVTLNRTALNVTDTTLAFVTTAGIGASVAWQDLIFYTMVDAEINATHRYHKGHALLFGFSGGVVYPFGVGQLKIEVEDSRSVSGADIERLRTIAGVNFNLNRALSIEFGFEKEEHVGFEVEQWGVGVNWYF